MRYIIRPLGPWLDPVTQDRRSASTFRATWDDTLALLSSEVEMLGGEDVVLQIDVQEGELRRDGMLRTNATVKFPGVRVSFTSVHGPLTYATDAYESRYYGGLTSWQANVRAIALGLLALRAVDRYGISARGQQYTGWTAISSRPAEMSREQAAEFLAHWAGLGTSLDLFADYPNAVHSAYRMAAKRVHPDRTGDDSDTMARLNAARDLLLNGARNA
jgi:hypothetical protein